jgi:hypothetical protein
VFRCQNNAAAFGNAAAPHSEIGFYQKTTADWPATAGGNDNPSIDTVNIKSAGDIEETAANHNMQQAKRMEILVDVPDINHKTDYKDSRPFGDSVGDDSDSTRAIFMYVPETAW